MTSANGFRAIIIGAGPIGLVVGNALQKAGLGFVIIEKYRSVLTDSGAGIMLWPHTTRIFDQLDLYEVCRGRYLHLDRRAMVKEHNGAIIRSTPIFQNLVDNHGYECMNFPRSQLIRTLFDGIEDREMKVRTGAGMRDIEETETGVRVHLSDGTIEEGSIVIGADGAHSATRDIMWRLAKEAGRRDIAQEESPVVSNYQILFGRATYIPGVEKGTFFQSQGRGRCTQISAGDDTMHFGIYRKLPGPTTAKKEYTQAEVEEFMASFADVYVMPGLTVKELAKHFEWTRLVNQHEALMENWYSGRVVLAGDSSAVMTAAVGMGVNNGIQSGITLVNQINDVLTRNPDPDTAAFEQAFQQYQSIRREEARGMCAISDRVIKGATRDSWLVWFYTDILTPLLFSDESLMNQLSKNLISKMHKVDFIRKDLKSGKVPWVSS
ncbi:FAD/NAD(P)-binding domain-containing protein [Xylariaceae sp. FL1019]|nr:FAD/NAD(P)-binding domain-containing protein [Xylariaceae sp. FL1019]